MINLTYLFLVILAVETLILLAVMIKGKKFFRCFFSSAFQGVAAMFAVNALGTVTGLHIAVNWYTLGFGMIFGTPGVIAMTLAKIIFSK